MLKLLISFVIGLIVIAAIVCLVSLYIKLVLWASKITGLDPFAVFMLSVLLFVIGVSAQIIGMAIYIEFM